MGCHFAEIMQNYQKGPVIGEGTYGSVICATQKATGRQVAIKKVRMCSNKEGVNMSVLRELKALKALQSPYVVDLLDVFSTKNSLVLVFEYMDWSLEDVIHDKSQPLSAADVKAYMQMLLQALAFVHGHQVAHRDIKPDNMLIGSNGVLKLADFGLARSLSDSPDAKLTPQVFGRWYRPPELLMGCAQYGCAVDMWAAGCVLAELLLRRPWFPGVCDMDQLDRIFKVLGVPTVQTWPGLANMPHRIDFKPAAGQPLGQVFPQASPDCLDLLQQLMQFDPQSRITAAAALQHPYFSSNPQATTPTNLPRPTTQRGGRRSAAMVPALMHDMLLRPALLLRQQQQGGFAAVDSSSNGQFGGSSRQGDGAAAGSGGVGSSRSLFAFSGSTSFSGRFLSGQTLAGAPEGFLGLSQIHNSISNNATGNGVSRLAQGASAGGFEGCSTEQEQRQQSLARVGSGGVLEEGPAIPWKGRLSFGSILDEPAGVPHEQQQQQHVSGTEASEQQQQQQMQGPQQLQHRRPSPVLQQQQQQQQQGKGLAGSMRPPLHRTAQPGASGVTPLPARPDSAGAAAVGSGDSHALGTAGAAAAAGGGRRRVSDLAAALSNAAAGGSSLGNGLSSSSLPPGLQAQQQQYNGIEATAAASAAAAMSTCTPAGAVVPLSRGGRGGSNAAAAAAGAAAAFMGPPSVPSDSTEDADMTCPMSLGTSAHKRSRAMYEAPAAAAEHQQQQHQGQAAGPMSVSGSGSRRNVRGRRSSMGSGCCSMDTDAAPMSVGGVAATGVAASAQAATGSDDVAVLGGPSCQQHQHQQQYAGGLNHLQSSSNGVLMAVGVAQGLGPAAAAAVAGSKQQELEAFLAGAGGAKLQLREQQQQIQQQQQQDGAHHTGALQLLRPWQLGSSSAGAGAGVADLQQQPAAAGGASAGSGGVAAGAAAAELSQGDEDAALRDCSHPLHSAGQPGSTGNASCCPMSLDQRAATAAHNLHQHHQGHFAADADAAGAGSTSGLSTVGMKDGEGCGFGTDQRSGGDVAGLGGPDDLAAMDPAEIEALAMWWRPRLDSAERRYLRCRKLQMDEALLQASQQDDEAALDNTFARPDFRHRSGLFGSPLESAEKLQQQQQQQSPAAAAAAAADAGTAAAVGGLVHGTQAGPAAAGCNGCGAQGQ